MFAKKKIEMENISALRMSSLSEEIRKIFDEDSENDKTFNGFSDSEIIGLCDTESSDSGDGPLVTQKPAAHSFQLRIALRSRPHAHPSSEEEEKHVKSEVEEKPVTTGVPTSGSDSDTSNAFLIKREENIRDNKAMLSQLMADLQKMPGGEVLLKKQSGKRLKGRASRPPRSGQAGGETRRNPERVSRRRTRSMGPGEDSAVSKEEELELSLEDELLQVRGVPRRRDNPRPRSSKPYMVRPVESITADELALVADNMTMKVYNSSTGSTCHQCRQKTIDTKTCCRNDGCRGIQGQFCGPCLRNRYGEGVREALLDPCWQCPPCRGICNCSFCRQRDGRCPTGILLPLAQYHGFSDVHSYLSSLRTKLNTMEEAEEDE